MICLESEYNCLTKKKRKKESEYNYTNGSGIQAMYGTLFFVKEKISMRHFDTSLLLIRKSKLIRNHKKRNIQIKVNNHMLKY